MEKINKSVSTIRYMGNKSKLLNHLNKIFDSMLAAGDVFCDLMAGTNSVGYSRIKQNKIISNDIQYYSFVIANALLKKTKYLKSHEVKEMYKKFSEKPLTKIVDIYADTYFSKTQCESIDKLRSFINLLSGRTKYISLTALMNAMCKAQSTSGHFAQYLPKENPRVSSLRSMDIEKLYFEKLSELDSLEIAIYENETFNDNVSSFLSSTDNKNVVCYYLDPPYTSDQYSRFYHLLDSVCKYDEISVDETKARYRTDRFKSDFCYKSTAGKAFEEIIQSCSNKKANLVISYSNKAVLPEEVIIDLCKRHYNSVEKLEIDFTHSSQGKGVKKIKEIIIVCKTNKEEL